MHIFLPQLDKKLATLTLHNTIEIVLVAGKKPSITKKIQVQPAKAYMQARLTRFLTSIPPGVPPCASSPE